MSKLNTAKLKEMIGQWLSTPEAKKELSWHYCRPSDDPEEIAEVAEAFNLPSDASAEKVNECILKEFSNSSAWKREEKVRMERDHIHLSDDVVDVIGEYNKNLYEKALSEGNAEKIWQRTFMPRHDLLGDNFRLEVYTTPDDTEVVAWTVIVD